MGFLMGGGGDVDVSDVDGDVDGDDVGWTSSGSDVGSVDADSVGDASVVASEAASVEAVSAASSLPETLSETGDGAVDSEPSALASTSFGIFVAVSSGVLLSLILSIGWIDIICIYR